MSMEMVATARIRDKDAQEKDLRMEVFWLQDTCSLKILFHPCLHYLPNERLGQGFIQRELQSAFMSTIRFHLPF